MVVIKKAINHFVDFHKGKVNIFLHIVGFAGVFYSIYIMNWIWFAVSLLILEAGHIYNHLVGIKTYDFRLKVNVCRLIIFLVVIAGFYFLSTLW